ncbi:MAG TPA: 50S ribosomal protein L5 [Deltaproteobacteria bacterium]|nr:MAG: 50S ribosomal protein L5 [bacterium]HDH10239.1 50S ribosomal protein L5 [Deltaproteobacteria bacterium]
MAEYRSRIETRYKEEVVPEMMKRFSYKNIMEVPRLVKIVINVGMGEAINDIKLLDAATDELSQITGQKAVLTRAKRSIANFKLRKDMPIGCMVTLRSRRMYDFFDRFVTFSLPRVRDFKGASTKSFDLKGNFSVGVREQLIFPEIEYDQVSKIHGMSISFLTTAKTAEEGKTLLSGLGMPFRK